MLPPHRWHPEHLRFWRRKCCHRTRGTPSTTKISGENFARVQAAPRKPLISRQKCCHRTGGTPSTNDFDGENAATAQLAPRAPQKLPAKTLLECRRHPG